MSDVKNIFRFKPICFLVSFVLWGIVSCSYHEISTSQMSLQPEAIKIQSENNSSNVDLSYMKEKLLSYKYYRVRKGDTLGKISKRFGVNVSDIKQINNMKNDLILIGELVKLPFKGFQETNLPLSSFWNNAYAKALAEKSEIYGTRIKRSGTCLRGVRIAVTQALRYQDLLGAKEKIVLGKSAHHLRIKAISNPRGLCQSAKLFPLAKEVELPMYDGLVFLYAKGRCGFSHRHGHVEILSDADSRLVCSDHCRVLPQKIKCQPDMILAPVHTCPS